MASDEDLANMMAGMSSSDESDFSDNESFSSPISHTASAEKAFMRQLANQKSISFSSAVEGKDNSENEDSINLDNDPDFSSCFIKKLPTTTPSSSPIQDSTFDDSDEEEDYRERDGKIVSNMVIMKENYNDYDDAGNSTSEDEGVRDGEYEEDSDDSEFDYDIPAARRLHQQPRQREPQQFQLQQQLLQQQQSFTSFNTNTSYNPYINDGFGADAKSTSYDSQVKSFGFRGATSASIDSNVNAQLAHHAQATYDAGDYSLQNKNEIEEKAEKKKKVVKKKVQENKEEERVVERDEVAEAKSTPSRAAESLRRRREDSEDDDRRLYTPPRRKMSFAEAKAPPPSPSTAPVNSKDVDERAIRQIADLNLTDQVRQDASPKQMTREKLSLPANANTANAPARIPTMSSKSGIYEATTPRSIIFDPIPMNEPMRKCYVVRSSNGVMGGKTYTMFREPPGDGPPGGGVNGSGATAEGRFMLNAKKKSGTKHSIYVISEDFAMPANAENTVGRLKGNWSGGSYTIYSGGVNPKKAPRNKGDLRTEIGIVLYEYDRMGPGKMKVCVPFLNNTKSGGKNWGFVDSIRGDLGDLADVEKLSHETIPSPLHNVLTVCQNKRPRWDANQKGHVLNFKGRVTESSVKNFQLECFKETGEETMLQFGRVSKNVFALDYRWPLNAVQAFGICLSSMDGKIADSKGFDMMRKYV